MRFDQVTSLLQPAELPYLSGVERLADGILHVAVQTRMPDVQPHMLQWWFGHYMQTTEHYRRWHPRDHVWMSWADKVPGEYIGAKHLVHEYIGGKFNKLRISFLPPSDYFGNHLDGHPDAVALCAVTGLLEQPVDVGRMVHLALPRHYGCDLHSRFWLGYVKSRTANRFVEAIGNLSIARKLAAPMSMGRALSVHCHEEMNTLAGFLPALYQQEHAGSTLQEQ